MSIFSRAIDAAFNRPDFADAATYYAGASNAGVPVKVIAVPAGSDAQFGDLRLKLSASNQTLAKIVDVRKIEVAEPKKGDMLVIGTERYEVVDPTLDDTGEIWTLGLRVKKP